MCDFSECCYLPARIRIKAAQELPDRYERPKCFGELDKFKDEWQKAEKACKLGLAGRDRAETELKQRFS